MNRALKWVTFINSPQLVGEDGHDFASDVGRTVFSFFRF